METYISKCIYLIGSLRNENIPDIGNKLRESLNCEVFDDWYAAGRIADDCWQEYENKRGRSYKEAIKGYAAKHVFAFDKHHLDRSDIAVLVMPAGRSGHIELGYHLGRGKPGYILFEKEPERYDQMYQFCTDVFFDIEDLIKELSNQSLSSRTNEWVQGFQLPPIYGGGTSFTGTGS